MAGKKDTVKDSDRFSIIVPNLSTCVVCGSKHNIACHEVIYGTANRKKSKEDGLCIGLCQAHHNMSNAGIHFNKQLDDYWKKQAEIAWIKEYSDSENGIKDFIRRYGKNYL